MVKKLDIVKYRKLVDFDIEFSENVNLISGGNGTCKSSLLYLVSNSYKKVIQNTKSKEIQNCLKIIQQLNNKFNPKVENLTKGDKTNNDPAKDITGDILNVTYLDGYSLSFRKHISGKGSSDFRYSLKPYYPKGESEKLPELPVIYLGLSRLITYGEIEDSSELSIPEEIMSSLSEENKEVLNDLITRNNSTPVLKSLNKKLPDDYIAYINEIYEDFTNVKINTSEKFTSLGKQKIRPDFTTEKEGVDSNTISAGEDNLYIILTALVSLRYYYETLCESESESEKEIESILLIDELDATLHPFFQEKLYTMLLEYSEKYKIQVIGTTHSIDLLEVALKRKQNVVYLMDLIQNVEKLKNPTGGNLDISLIRNFLKQKRNQDDYSKKIAVFTEDNEARLLIEVTLDYIKSLDKDNNLFERASSYLHFVDMNLGSESLINMFSDTYLVNNLVNAFCILDGDKSNDWPKKIITLPGNKNPEELLLNYLKLLIERTEYINFWTQPTLIEYAYQKSYVIENIMKKQEKIEEDILKAKQAGKSTSGMRREKYKELFKEDTFFLLQVYKYWLNDVSNEKEVKEFIKDFATMFNKLRAIAGISTNLILPTVLAEVSKEPMGIG
ncbi:ATP-binding protein [Viridibacillus sp. YIM B01967]|uniref:ATP-binding protein n=1 Tax=Viridibacillus soli TaxID=2798301 RepID=A0ABS1HD01_9BACL|nr:AAA family ATPase [Viridibacillus soli]MBK3497261.1 ATP-binding protein [Viridibacillus soli]